MLWILDRSLSHPFYSYVGFLFELGFTLDNQVIGFLRLGSGNSHLNGESWEACLRRYERKNKTTRNKYLQRVGLSTD